MIEEEIILSCWKDAIQAVKMRSSLGPGFCLSHLEILITVCLNDGITRNNLIKRIAAISPTTIKRYVKDLVNGYEYITETNSDGDSRIKHLHISERGQQLIDIMVNKARKWIPTL